MSISDYPHNVNKRAGQIDPEKRWRYYKLQSLDMASRMMQHKALINRAVRMQWCGRPLAMSVCPICGRKHIKGEHMCHDRMCPLCQWQLSRVRFAQMLECLRLLDEQLTARNCKIGMMTLTLRNVPLSKLRATLKLMAEAWNNMSRRQFWQRAVVGSARHVEITYNTTANTYHPHLHILVITITENPVELHKIARAAWKHALKIDYDPITDYREAYVKDAEKAAEVASITERPVIDWQTNKQAANAAAARECAKYILGQKAMASIPDKDLARFAAAISGLRMVSYTGLLKLARQALAYKDEQIVDAEPSEASRQCCGVELEHYVLEWSGTGYVKIPLDGKRALEVHE